MSHTELIDAVFARPRMYCTRIETFHDVLVFAQGVCCGLRPPHGSDTLLGFGDFLLKRFPDAQAQAWTEILDTHFGHMSVDEACDAVRELIREWHQQ